MNGQLSVNEHLKLRLMSEPIRALPMDTGTYTLDCDTSNYGRIVPGAIKNREGNRLFVKDNEQARATL